MTIADDDKRPDFELVPPEYRPDDPLNPFQVKEIEYERLLSDLSLLKSGDLRQEDVPEVVKRIAETASKLLTTTPLISVLSSDFPEDFKDDGINNVLSTYKEIEPTLRVEAEKQGIALNDIHKLPFGLIADLLAGAVREHPLQKIFTQALLNRKLPKLAKSNIDIVRVANNRLVNQALNGDLPIPNAQPFNLKVQNKPELYTRTTISIEGIAPNLEITRSLSNFGRIVWDAFNSLAEAGLQIVSVGQIYRAMPGSGGKEPSAEMIDQIIGEVNNQIRTYFTIDASSEINKGDKTKTAATAKWEGHLLHVEHITARSENGQTTHAFRILGTSGVFEYAKATGQVLSISTDIYNIRKTKKVSDGASHSFKLLAASVTMSNDRRCILSYLSRRVEVMKNDKKKGGKRQVTKILLDSMYKQCDIGELAREKIRAREFAETVFVNWVDKGYIKGYEIERADNARKTPISFVIELF